MHQGVLLFCEMQLAMQLCTLFNYVFLGAQQPCYSQPSLQVWGMLVEMRIDSISGFDLSALNAFRWHPHHDRVDLSRYAAVGTGQVCFGH